MFTAIIIPVIGVVAIGLIAGIGLTLASRFMAVNEDETVAEINAVLPGANCGACGFAGCADYASALVEKEGTPPNACPVGGAEVAKKIGAILGVDAGDVNAKYARVKCFGTYANTPFVMDYRGIASCAVSKTFFAGRYACQSSCLGFGDCLPACEYGAIAIVNGVAVIDKAKCVGCGLCAARCPNALIELADAKSTIYVSCSNREPGGVTRELCRVGCIGCMKCAKACKFDAVKVEDHLAVIDPLLCKNCGLCMKECPVGAIHSNRVKAIKKQAV
jgi:Na+-translocating ferredoxin:NAD+ oxidoreductase RNF subunit RnfB